MTDPRQNTPPAQDGSAENGSSTSGSGASSSAAAPMSLSRSSSLPPDDGALPRPHSQQRSTATAAFLGISSSYDAVNDLSPAGSARASASARQRLHTDGSDEDDVELMRQRLLSTPVSGEAVSARLLQALPQLSLSHWLHEFNSQTPPWPTFANEPRETTDSGGRGSSAALEATSVEETSGLLPASAQSRSPPRSRRRSNSAAASLLQDRFPDGASSSRGDTTAAQGVNPDATSALPPLPPATGPRRTTVEESEDQTAMEELQALLRRCHNSLPFLTLFLVYFAYQHATGILVLVVGTVAVMGLDQRLRVQIALKEEASAWHLLGIVGMCAIDMVAICSVDGEPNPLRHFSHIWRATAARSSPSESTEGLSTSGIFWEVLWTVLVNDFLVRLWSLVAKAAVAAVNSERALCWSSPNRDVAANETELSADSPILSEDRDANDGAAVPPPPRHASSVSFYRRKRKLYGIIEMSSIFLRSLLAGIPWCGFYQLCASKFMADVFTFAYLFIKGLILGTQGRRILALLRSLVTLGLEFGVYVTPDELVEAGSPDCSICYEAMQRPVKLVCSHMFCEECVTEWFDRERSCPLCRASVGPSRLTDDEGIKPQYLDGRTSLVPQLL